MRVFFIAAKMETKLSSTNELINIVESYIPWNTIQPKEALSTSVFWCCPKVIANHRGPRDNSKDLAHALHAGDMQRFDPQHWTQPGDNSQHQQSKSVGVALAEEVDSQGLGWGCLVLCIKSCPSIVSPCLKFLIFKEITSWWVTKIVKPRKHYLKWHKLQIEGQIYNSIYYKAPKTGLLKGKKSSVPREEWEYLRVQSSCWDNERIWGTVVTVTITLWSYLIPLHYWLINV